MGDTERMQQRAEAIDDAYLKSRPEWGLREYAEGMMGDLGDLMKLVQAKHGLRHKDDIDAGIEHEINDLAWSVLMMYRAIGRNPVDSFLQWADETDEALGKA